ncbi:MAG: hypothetical protein FOGNACKC_06086 [Anaerolineae bacterium]|nr:hypothetical protein [Anaerolineae bacterium]
MPHSTLRQLFPLGLILLLALLLALLLGQTLAPACCNPP